MNGPLLRTDAETHEPHLQEGTRLTLHFERQTERKSVGVIVERIEDKFIWVKGSCPSSKQGETVLVEYKIDDDARYLLRGLIRELSSDCSVVLREAPWQRVQDRSFVRISTHMIEVRVPRPVSLAEGQSEEDKLVAVEAQRFEMLDVSAGGLRFKSDEAFEYHEEFVCDFDLTHRIHYSLPARVVRTQKRSGPREQYAIAVEFVDLSEKVRAELLQWIYREQARRHRKKQDR